MFDYEKKPPTAEGSLTQHTFTSVVINAPMYLEYLLEIARGLGIHELHEELPCNSNLAESLRAAKELVEARLGKNEVAAYVNATGISALDFVPDPNIYPVRGQTITVAREAKQITTIEGYASQDRTGTPIMYVLPRPHSNTTILGGTKDIGNWSAEHDPSTTDEILRRAKEWAPELLDVNGNFQVLSVQVGLRPARKGGVRVEMEHFGDFVVCHAYGHAGAGYQNSVGSANKVARILGEWFDEEEANIKAD